MAACRTPRGEQNWEGVEEGVACGAREPQRAGPLHPSTPCSACRIPAPQEANYYGSLTQAGTMNLGLDGNGQEVFVPFSALLPMVAPNDLVFDGGQSLGTGWG